MINKSVNLEIQGTPNFFRKCWCNLLLLIIFINKCPPKGRKSGHSELKKYTILSFRFFFIFYVFLNTSHEIIYAFLNAKNASHETDAWDTLSITLSFLWHQKSKGLRCFCDNKIWSQQIKWRENLSIAHFACLHFTSHFTLSNQQA